MDAYAHERKTLLLLLLCGSIAGFLNGFLGAGGGIVLIFALPRLLKGSDPKDNFAFCVAVIFVFCCISAGFDHVSGQGIANTVALAIPAGAGGLLGAFLLDKIHTRALKLIFAAIMAYAGLNMIF